MNDYFKEVNRCPAIILSVLTLSVVLMNLFANKSILFNSDIIAVDCGILLSGITSLCLDILTRLYGATYATKVAYFSIILNVIMSVVFFIVGIIPGLWGSEQNIIIDKIFQGNAFVVFGSIIAYAVSTIINNYSNEFLAGFVKDKGGCNLLIFTVSSYVSTLISQIIDNFIFNMIVLRVILSWNLYKCTACSIITAVFELLVEIIFSSIGYKYIRSLCD